MLKKFFTVVIIPRRTESVKKIRVAKNLFFILTVLTAVLLAGWVYMILDYFSLRSDLRELEDIESRYLNQEEKIKEFSTKFENVQFHFENLNTLNEKLRSMASITAESQAKSNREKEEEYQKKVEVAQKDGILETISTEVTEVDSDLYHNREYNYLNLTKFFKEKRNPLARIPNSWPVKGFIVNEFGLTADPYTGEIRTQPGIDISTRNFHPVNAPADGIVIELNKDDYFGNLLVIDHGNGFVTRYGHLVRYEVEEGDVIVKGKVIAQAGISGRTTGPRLHYEILFNNIPQNPAKYMRD